MQYNCIQSTLVTSSFKYKYELKLINSIFLDLLEKKQAPHDQRDMSTFTWTIESSRSREQWPFRRVCRGCRQRTKLNMQIDKVALEDLPRFACLVKPLPDVIQQWRLKSLVFRVYRGELLIRLVDPASR